MRSILKTAPLFSALLAAGVLALSARVSTAAEDRHASWPETPPCGRVAKDDDSDGCAFFLRMKLQPLRAPPGGRAYRETWAGPFIGPMNNGSIVLTVSADGSRNLQTPWSGRPFKLKSDELPDFEAALARSDFGEWAPYNQLDALCVDGVATLVETIVDGRYRRVYFDYCGGVMSESVALALDQLFVLAAGKSGLKYPVNSERPTFRG